METEIQRILAKRRQRLGQTDSNQINAQKQGNVNNINNNNTSNNNMQTTQETDDNLKYYIPPQIYQQSLNDEKSLYQFKPKNQLPNSKLHYQKEIDEIKKQALIEQLQQTQKPTVKSSQSELQDQINELINQPNQIPGSQYYDVNVQDMNPNDLISQNNIYNIDNHFKHQIPVEKAAYYMQNPDSPMADDLRSQNVFLFKNQTIFQQNNQSIDDELNQLISQQGNDISKSKSMLLQFIETNNANQSNIDINSELDMLLNMTQKSFNEPNDQNEDSQDEIKEKLEDDSMQERKQIDVEQFISDTLNQKKEPFDLPNWNPQIAHIAQPVPLIYRTESELDRYVREQIEKNKNVYANPLQLGPRDYKILNAQESLINKNMLMQLIK